jgi:hypothetical protein
VSDASTPSSPQPIDPSALPREDPREDQRWPVTILGVSTREVAEIVRLLDGAHIACHVETVSPRVRGMESEGVTGLYDVLVREQDLRPAVEVLKPAFPERFPGEQLPDDSLWDFEAFGPAPVALCRLSWAQSWDLSAALRRAGIKAIVLPDDVSGPKQPASESIGSALAEEAHDELEAIEDWTDLGPGTHESTPIEDRWYVVVVLRPDLDRATELASKALGSDFQLDGSAYDG